MLRDAVVRRRDSRWQCANDSSVTLIKFKKRALIIRDRELQVTNQPIVICMRANPEPDDCVVLPNAECPIINADAR